VPGVARQAVSQSSMHWKWPTLPPFHNTNCVLCYSEVCTRHVSGTDSSDLFHTLSNTCLLTPVLPLCRYGFVVYQDPAVTEIAIAGLNGLKMGDRTLTVRRADVSAVTCYHVSTGICKCPSRALSVS
jgi:hypothetical protein